MGLARTMLVAAALLAGGCGSASYVVLEIDAEPDVHGEINKLRVLVFASGDSDRIVDMSVPLRPEQSFPVDFGLEPSDTTPSRLGAVVEGWLSEVGEPETQIAETVEKEFSWDTNEVVRVKMPRLVLIQ